MKNLLFLLELFLPAIINSLVRIPGNKEEYSLFQKTHAHVVKTIDIDENRIQHILR
ncbi:hypothetical protein MMC2321_03649 [Chitinophaga sp. MM2321]